MSPTTRYLRPQVIADLVVASALLKWVHFQQDTQGRDVDVQNADGIRLMPAAALLAGLV